jgi:hypothetical protein
VSWREEIRVLGEEVEGVEGAGGMACYGDAFDVQVGKE